MDKELLDAASAFMHYVELVLDHDWDHSKEILTNSKDLKYYIAESGTFLSPKVEDESNNWGNRGSFLDAYRRLGDVLATRGVPYRVGEWGRE